MNDYILLYKTVLDYTVLYMIQDHAGIYKTKQAIIEHRTVQDYTGLYRTIQDYTGQYKTIQDYTGLYRTIQEYA